MTQGHSRRALLVAGMAVAAAARPARAAATAVVIEEFAFAPASVTVPTGTTVAWENRDSTPHTIVSAANPRSFRSPALDTGEGFETRFATPGTYRYFCSLHPHMQGVVVVE
jgi:plastocyanin